MEEKKVPALRFRGFDNAWEQHKVKELCNIGTGKSNTQDQVEDGIYPFYIRSDIPVKSNKYLYDCEAVITIGDGNIGRVFHYVNGKFDLHQRCYKMRDFQDILGKYFYYFFSTRFYDRAMKMTAKATVDSVRLEMISEMDIWKPIQRDEQKKIAKFLTNLDRLISLHQRKLEMLKKVKKSMLEKMFPKNDAKVPEVRFSDFTDAWEQRKLGDSLSFLKDGTHGTHADSIDGPLLLSAKNIKNGSVNWDETDRRISQDEYDKIHSNFNLENGDILLTIVGSIGETAILKDSSGLTFQRSVAFLRPKEEVTSEFLYTEIQIPAFQKELESRKSTSAQPGIYLGDLSEIPVVISKSKDEQRKIGSYFANLDNLIILHQRKLEKLKNIKKSMLEKMFII